MSKMCVCVCVSQHDTEFSEVVYADSHHGVTRFRYRGIIDTHQFLEH